MLLFNLKKIEMFYNIKLKIADCIYITLNIIFTLSVLKNILVYFDDRF